jgi:hypothetical protein
MEKECLKGLVMLCAVMHCISVDEIRVFVGNKLGEVVVIHAHLVDTLTLVVNDGTSDYIDTEQPCSRI